MHLGPTTTTPPTVPPPSRHVTPRRLLTKTCACPGHTKTYRYTGRAAADERPLTGGPAAAIFSRNSRGHTWNLSSSFWTLELLLLGGGRRGWKNE